MSEGTGDEVDHPDQSAFWYLTWPDETSVSVSVAEGVDDPERDRLLAGIDPIAGWSVPLLVVESDELVDYLPSNLGVRLCSRRLRDVIDVNVSAHDMVQWLAADVVDIFGTSHEYFVLHLPGEIDILNTSRSIMAGDFVVKAVIEREKARGRHLFRIRESIHTVLVSADLKAMIVDAAITGVWFEPAATA